MAITPQEDGVWIDANQAEIEMFGYTCEELMGESVMDTNLWVDPNDRQSFVAALAENGEVRNQKAQLRRKDGSLIIASVSANSLTLKGVKHILFATEDITERKQAEEERALNAQRMDVLLQLNQMTEATLQEITDFALEEAVRLTQSTIGYLAFLNDDESVLTMHSWSKSAMAECAIADKPIIYPVETTGLWGEAVRQRRPVITNDYTAAGPLKKGYPEGHVAVKRHMNTPVFVGSRIVLVAGVGNKAEEYDQDDVQQLTLLMEGMWRLIERKRAEEALRESEEKFRLTLSSSPDAVVISRLDDGLYRCQQRVHPIDRLYP